MNYWIEGDELVVKRLFREKRYSFEAITRVNFQNGIAVYIGSKCILERKNLFEEVEYQYDIYHLAEKYGFIIEDTASSKTEISVLDVHFYSNQVRDMMQSLFGDYVKQELGEEYEFLISTDETPFLVRMFFDIYRNGVKLSINDEKERQWFCDWENGKKKMHLVWIYLVEAEYANPKTQEYRLTKKVDLKDDIAEIKRMIAKMKEYGSVPSSQYEEYRE